LLDTVAVIVVAEPTATHGVIRVNPEAISNSSL
jgi:hypothetical protein